jgi:GNAT superfamily N-acetyltransferase
MCFSGATCPRFQPRLLAHSLHRRPGPPWRPPERKAGRGAGREPRKLPAHPAKHRSDEKLCFGRWPLVGQMPPPRLSTVPEAEAAGAWNNITLVRKAFAAKTVTVCRDTSGHPIGFLWATGREDGLRREVQIVEVRVATRRQGVGTALMRHYLEECRKTDVIGVLSHCVTEGGVKLCERAGMLPVPAWSHNSGPDRHRLVSEHRYLLFDRPSVASPDVWPITAQLQLFGGNTALLPPLRTHARQSADGSVVVLQKEFVHYAGYDLFVEVWLDGKQFRRNKVKNLVEHGAQRADPFVRIRELRVPRPDEQWVWRNG